MENIGIYNKELDLASIGIKNAKKIYWNVERAELQEHAIRKNLGVHTETGALMIETGKFTGRSPKDRFIVKDDITRNSVDWGDINMPISPEHFDGLLEKMKSFVQDKDLYVNDVYACADERYRLRVRVISEYPWQSLFASNLFIRPERENIEKANPEWHVLAIPSFKANPDIDGTRQDNFAIINFTKKTIIIGGTAYTGEIKKGIFSVLNFVLPHDMNVLSMHCSANVGVNDDTTIFFGLSGTGKTTLSADPLRRLIGDDEHGWSDDGIFNFEGGCYAKVIYLSHKGEPQIYNAIRFGALIENTKFVKGTRIVDFDNSEITENTRVGYPLHFIDKSVIPSIGKTPKNIFFLTCDAFGVLPPISRLNAAQTMFHFISGYTAKVAGTEAGITEPQTVFSACFGAPFMPLHPTTYAEMLGKKMEDNKVNVWLVNTGWSGGPYGVGKRMKLKYTRAMITAALNNKLDKVEYVTDQIFGLRIPQSCLNVPSTVLNPIDTWSDKAAYKAKANELARQFMQNFEKYADQASAEIINAAPKVSVDA
jgi:phosphoenolpyruvate carboxykinase (ATP)